MSGISLEDLKDRYHFTVSTLDSRFFQDESCRKVLREHFKVGSLEGLGLGDYDCGVIAAGAVLQYLYETQKSTLDHLTTIVPYATGNYMVLDSSTRRNLELLETMREKQKRGSLLWVLDKTRTAMGARLLRTWIEQPLISKEEILKRQNAIEELNLNYISREELGEYLNPVYDLERLIGRISYKTANPRDLLAFRNSIAMVPHIKRLLGEFTSDALKELAEDLDPLEDLNDLITRAIVEEPPITVREGGMIKDGYNEEADRLRHAKTEGKTWLAELEARERDSTGIKNLKVKYNKVFGYYFEVTNSFKDLVPEYFIRKQTLTNAERYTTDDLKNLEDVILGAEDKLFSLEYDLFCEVRDAIAAEVVRIQKTARAIAAIDVFASLSTVATRNNYVKPQINEKGTIQIKGGRHPVVEKMMRDDMFVANDTILDNSKNRISIITGPNMAGKSTFLRQNAIIAIMAQMGSFVPCKSAHIGIVDKIFSRVGASDDLARGRSTFMVEMVETASILNQADERSFVILDEIGRGTATFDGLSIAWAVIEHLHEANRCRALFATHYHELTSLVSKLTRMSLHCMKIKEFNEEVVFLHEVISGAADRSYGIHVAKLAGLPKVVIKRAEQVLQSLESDNSHKNVAELADDLPLFASLKPKEEVVPVKSELAEFLEHLNPDDLTPREALEKLYELKNLSADKAA